jgi:hypothetical protein
MGLLNSINAILPAVGKQGIPLILRGMRIFFCFLFSFCFAVAASAQKVYFIYLESETRGPFYVKMGDQVLNGGSGYLVLSNLVDSTYNFSVGYPSTGVEGRFTLSLSGRDRGFLIKNFDYGLGLFDLQNLSVIRPQVDESRKNTSYRSRNDDFTLLLAKVSNDSSLLVVPIAVKEDVVVKKDEEARPITESQTTKTNTFVPPPQTDITETKKTDPPVEGEKKNDVSESAVTLKKDLVDSTAVVPQKDAEKQAVDSSVLTSIAEPSHIAETSYKRSVIKKHSESSTSEGFGLVFYDNYDGGSDTIRLLIPNPRVILKEPGQTETVDDLEIKKDSIVQPKVVVVPATNSGIVVKSDCKSTASENDFFKLRRNMAAKNSDDSMVGEAKKAFKSKCFTTEQIRNLGTLFLTSAGKYQFFDAAYLHVTDREKFESLESEIKDDYYLKRFKALVGK